ncbi:MAG: histidine--tRNA ligase [Candidatus Aerophobetes bacterium]|nr:histidine--tRNA ligase [Candidatus Aerophobetes bacterium]
MMIRTPRGVEDILPHQSPKYQWMEKEASSLFHLYGYEEIRVPSFEKTELFLRSVGKETDVGKQMYIFKDKKGRSLSLRPEATASVARAYIQHRLYEKSEDWRVYYIGPMFRYERPQAGRLREFRQIGVEVLGEAAPQLDVEIIEMASQFLKRLGLANFKVQLNSIGCKKCRPEYEKRLKEYFKRNLDSLCPVCQKRYKHNVLRILDCKEESCQKVIERAPLLRDHLCENCQIHFEKVKMGLKDTGIEFNLNPYLVRGLDYYTRTTFEFTIPSLGAQDTICGGGRYDELVEELGGPSIPGIGFSIGVERLLVALEGEGMKFFPKDSPGVYVITLGEESQKIGYYLANLLRSKGIKTCMSFSGNSLSSQLRLANRKEVRWTIIIGEEEVDKERLMLKDMKSGKQREIEWKKLEEFSQNLNFQLTEKAGLED